MNSLAQRVAVITGAAGNLGTAVARTYAQAGANVVLLDRESDRLSRQFPDLATSPDHLLLNGVDFSAEDSVRQAMESAREHFGRIDVLVNTVGSWRGGLPTHLAPLADWDYLFAANVRPTLLACRAVVPHLLAQRRGCIINIAARSAVAGTAGSAAYSAAKSSILRLTESLSAELKHKGINVNALLPAVIDTPQNRSAMPDADYSQWVEPRAIAEVVLFLASDAARAIHGAAIPVYGLA
jgi:NAD(P)-dependent dehydrogenase (short-subunit alcohol dehydrogenase family)